jgi:hypothetical protein
LYKIGSATISVAQDQQVALKGFSYSHGTTNLSNGIAGPFVRRVGRLQLGDHFWFECVDRTMAGYADLLNRERFHVTIFLFVALGHYFTFV